MKRSEIELDLEEKNKQLKKQQKDYQDLKQTLAEAKVSLSSI